MTQNISILGAGSWGTTLAILAARNGCNTLLWGHKSEHIAALKQAKENKRFLPGVKLPNNLVLANDIKKAAAFSRILLIAVPSHAFKHTLLKIRPCVDKEIHIAWATKGFNPDDGSFLHQIVANVFNQDIPTAILSGPTFAAEVAAELPTAITLASHQEEFAEQLAAILRGPRFRIYTSSDLIGVQIGGAVKNVLAIAAGIADGLKLGANTRAALITRGLQEVMRLGGALGGKQETFMGLAGLGDLLLTCTDDQSRNRRFGIALGKGKLQQQILKDINQEIEGIAAAKETYLLAQKHDVDMPIVEQTYKVIYENLPPLTAVNNLLGREQKKEI